MNLTTAKKHHSKGFGLVETLLTVGALSVLSLGIYMVLRPTSASAQISVESENLRELATSIDRSFGLVGGFDGVSSSRVMTDGLAPPRMAQGNTLKTQWGAPVLVTAASVSSPNDAFVVTYPGTPPEICSGLASAVSRQAFDIRVDGSSVINNGQLEPSAAASACGRNAAGVTMEFVYHSGLVAGTAVAAPPLELPDAPPSVAAPVAPPAGSPVGPVDGVGGATPLNPVVTNPPASPAPAPPSLPPTLAPVETVTPPPTSVPPTIGGPIGTVSACVVPGNSVENQSVVCPAGQYGLITQSRFATWSCPEAWDSPVRGSFSSWSTVGGSCNACPGSSTQAQTQWVRASAPCPANHTGTNVWEKEQSQSRSVSYSCPAGTVSLPAPTIGGWSAWADTGATRNQANTCTPNPVSNCQWRQDSASYAPNFGSLDGETVSYNDGAGSGCSASWGGRSGVTDRTAFNACVNMIPNSPPRAGANYFMSEYTGWGGGMENLFSYVADCPQPTTVWKWVMTENSVGGCGSQGGGSGGQVCGAQGGPTDKYGCNGEVCNASASGASYATGYAERMDAQWPACDYQVYQCQQVTE